MSSRAFYSYESFEDAKFQAKMAGYTNFTGQVFNRGRQYVVFAKPSGGGIVGMM